MTMTDLVSRCKKGRRYRLTELQRMGKNIYWKVDGLRRDSGKQACFVVCYDPSAVVEQFRFAPPDACNLCEENYMEQDGEKL